MVGRIYSMKNKDLQRFYGVTAEKHANFCKKG